MVKTNAHTHLDNTESAQICPRKPVSFISWLVRAGLEFSKRNDIQCIEGVRKGIEQLLACGTTHIGDISAHWKGIEEIFSSDLEGTVFLEVMGLQREKALSRLEKAKKAILRLRNHPKYGKVRLGLSLHSPYACHFELLVQGAEWCHKENIQLCIHAAESPLEKAILLGKTDKGFPIGWLKLLYQAFPGAQPPKMSPVLYLDSLCVLDVKPILVHTVNVTDADVELLANKNCAVVHCPRSNYLLSCGRMPIEKFLKAGVTVYFGTDGLSSSPSLDVSDEVQFAKEYHSGFIDFVDKKMIDKLIERPFP